MQQQEMQMASMTKQPETISTKQPSSAQSWTFVGKIFDVAIRFPIWAVSKWL